MDNFNFETTLKELEKTVEQLENGECTLDESIKLFEKGIKLSEACRKVLSDAQQKILTITDAEKEAENRD